MIYVRGDTHGDIRPFVEGTLGDADWTENDYLIICGDFGFVFLEDDRERQKLDILESKPYHILFVDGNHENFPAIYSYPEQTWNGGRVHVIRKNVMHLMRGQVFTIDGKTFFTFGGARSTDREYRREGYSWWPEELPSDEEFCEGISNLDAHNYKVDYIITHTAPQKMIERLKILHPYDLYTLYDEDVDSKEFLSRLGNIELLTDYGHWYFGHWHFNTRISEKSTVLLDKVVEIK